MTLKFIHDFLQVRLKKGNPTFFNYMKRMDLHFHGNDMQVLSLLFCSAVFS